MIKKITTILLLLICLTLLGNERVFATHTATNIAVSNLNVIISPVGPSQITWTPTSTPGQIKIGTNATDPIVGSTESLNFSAGQSLILYSPSLPTGTYYAAMYTGIYGEVLMSNIKSFTIGTPPEDDTDSGGAGCSDFESCTDVESAAESDGGYTGNNFITTLVSKILPMVLILGGFLSVIIIVISGIQFITSNGNPDGAAAARSRLTFALVGFVLLTLAFGITKFIDIMFLRGSGVF